MAGRYAPVFVHLIWTTKNREHWITPDVHDSLLQFFKQTSQNLDCTLIAFGSMPDHVHLLLQLGGTKHSIGEVVQRLKGGSAHRITHEIQLDPYFKWQRGYSVFSVNPADTEVVKAYILNQRKHHSAGTLRDEWENTE